MGFVKFIATHKITFNQLLKIDKAKATIFRAAIKLIDIFEKDGVYYISEVNPRFGGGYPHAYACGADHMVLIRNNLAGIANKRQIGQYQTGKVMMKYNEIMMVDEVQE